MIQGVLAITPIWVRVTQSPSHLIARGLMAMNVKERSEVAELRESVQNLAVQVARLSQAIEPLVRLQEEQALLRDRVGDLLGFRSAVLWLTGLVGAGALVRYALMLLIGGTTR